MIRVVFLAADRSVPLEAMDWPTTPRQGDRISVAGRDWIIDFVQWVVNTQHVSRYDVQANVHLIAQEQK